MSLFPQDIKEFEKQAFQCKHCKTVFMAGPNEWHYVKPEERRIQDEKSALKNFPKEIKKEMQGYGCATIIGEIIDDHICPRTAYPSCNDWTKDNCLEYRRVVYDLYDKVK